VTVASVRLGLRANAAQFSLLVGLNALVGALVGLERSVLPLVGSHDFGLRSKIAVLTFILAFGSAKALTNLAGGALARRGRKPVLLLGWLLALPVAPLLAVAPSWAWVVVANLFLGVNQGLAWSMTVVMKVDLVGPKRRGLALGLNESAGYAGVAVAASASGLLASEFVARDVLVIAGFIVAAAALLITLAFVRDTGRHVALEQARHNPSESGSPPRLRDAFPDTSYRMPTLRSSSQAGLLNNLNDALVWGLVPLFLASRERVPARSGWWPGSTRPSGASASSGPGTGRTGWAVSL
jgi:MFS family permease